MSIKRNIVSKFCALASKRAHDTCRFVFERPFERRVENKMSSPRTLALHVPSARFIAAAVLAAGLALGFESAEANFVPGAFNSWTQNTPMSTIGMRGNFQRYSVAASVDNGFKILRWNNNWNAGWGSGYWITSWNTVWSLPYSGDGGPYSDLFVKSTFVTGRTMSVVTRTDNSNETEKFGFMMTSGTPRTISSVSGGTGTVAASSAVAIDITLSAAKLSEEFVLVRYTRDGFANSSFVTATLVSGSTYRATIPAAANASTGTVTWYAMTSTVEAPSTDTDFLTLTVLNNSGSNYSYTVANSPTVTTPTASSITATSATLGGTVTSNGGAALSSRGTVYGTSAAPTGNSLAEGGTSVAAFSHSRTGLTANTLYTYRAYAVNGAGTSYSADATFTTLPAAPTVGTGSSATTTGFTANWSHPTMGAVSYTYTVEVDNDINFGSIDATASSISSANTSRAITGLAAGTTYYFRVRAVNSQGAGANSSTSAGIATSAASAVISSSGTPGALSTTYGTASSSTSFSVSGTSMAAGILVTPPAGFQVSTNNSTFSSTVTVGAAGTISSTLVYVRLAATASAGSKSGNIVLTSSGAANVNVATTASTVNAKALSITAPSIASKAYDGTTTAGAVTVGTLSGFVGSETVTATATAAAYSSANVGSYSNVVVTYSLANGTNGGLASNYSLAAGSATGTITAKALSVTAPSIASKVYDGTTTAGAVTVGTLSGFVGTQTVTATATAAAYSSKNVGSYSGVVVTYSLANGANGGLASNYSLAAGSATGTVTAKALSITVPTIAAKAYNGTATAGAVTVGTLSGFVGTETVTATGTAANYSSANAGSYAGVVVTYILANGANGGLASNYSLANGTATGVINKANPTITTNPAASGIKYAQALSASSFSGGTTTPAAGTWTWNSPSTIPAPGTASYAATFTPTDTTNYNTGSANISVTSQIAQARNTAGAASPTQPSAIYLGDTNRTFGADTWGTIDGAYGRGRLFVRHSNSNVLGGSASPWTDFVNTDAKTITNSPQFTNTGTWFWGIQMDYGATYGTNFWYKTATNAWSDMSTNDVGSTLSVTVQALPNPTSVTASNASTTSVALNWARGTASGNTYDTVVVRHTNSSITDPTQGTTYNPGGSPTNTGAGTVVYRGSGTNYTDTSLTQGTTYYYKVYAENWSYYSTGVSTNATPSTTPGTPTSVVITPGNAQLSVAFTAPSNGGSAITDYEYSTDGGTSFESAGTTSSPITITTVSASSASLVNGTPYSVQIRARNANGVGTATTASSSTPVTTPGAPTITGITAGSGQLSVAFTAPSSTGGSAITNYEYSTNNGSSYTAVSPASTASPIVITGLSNGASYTVRIRAVSAVGSGTASSSSSGTPVAAPTLSAVTLGSALTNTYGTASADVSFTASGIDLSANITATAQSGFEVSTSASSGYGSSVSVASGTTVYVRFAARRAAGTHNSTTAAVLSSTGASNVNVTTSASSNAVAQKALTISGATATNRDYNALTTVTVSGGSLVGVESGDTVTLGGTPTGTVSTATVAAGKAVTVTGYSISGTDSGNYSLAQPTGVTVDITKATPSVTTAPTASGIYYAQTLAASSLTGGTVSPSGGTWTWTTPATVATPGTASYSATYTPTDTTNYNNATTNVSLTSSMAQARNIGGSATPGAPSSIYLGDTNRTFTSETWGTISGTNGSARLVIRYDNADLTGGGSQGFATADSNDTNSLGSVQFTNTGTWYWGVQMNYGSPFGSNFWYKTSSAGWTNMSTNGADATLNVTVLALPNPSSVAFSSTGTNQTTIGWTAATAGGNTYQTVVVRHSSSNITDPTNGTSYSTSDSTGGGTVVYKGFGTNFTDTGLSASTSYYYKLYAENWNYYSSGAATNVTTTGVPTLTIGGATNATATAFTNTYGTASTAQTFTIAGSNLTNNVTATAPTGFEVSTNGTSYASTTTFTQSGGSAGGTLHVRLATNATASTTDYNSQNISLTSSGLTRNITTAASGNAVNKKALTVTANDQTVVFGTSVAAVTGDGSVTYTGFANGDTSSVITGTPTYTTTYTASTAADTAGVTITPVTTSLTATNYSFTPANGTITVTALNNPSSLTVSKNSSLPMTSVNLSWAKSQNRDVLIVRNTSDTWTAPTVGTQYSAGDTIGTGTVVYESGGTSTTDNGLTPGATYYYRFYSENYLSYSTGTTGSSVTLDAVQARNASGAATPSVTLTNGSNATLYVGDTARFSFDATPTIASSTDTNWGQPRLRLKFNDADVSTGALTATNDFTNATNKSVISTNRFTNSGTWYWAMQMSYGTGYGSAFWYKASTATYTNMAADGTNSSLSFSVSALPDPSSVSVTASGPTTNNVSFTRSGRTGGEFAAFVVRKASSAVDWTPTPGTTYTNGYTTNGNVVVDAANFGSSVTDTGLVAGTTYHYKLFSENWGYYSAGATSSVTTAPSAPAAPNISAVTASNFTATWVNPGGATNYFLDVSTATNFATYVTGYSNKAVAALTDSVTGLAANTTYHVRVRAQSSGGTSSNSPTASQLTAPAAPAEPTAATVLATSFTVNWTAVTGASSYRLDVATDSGFTSFVSGFENKTLSALTDSLSGLTAGTTYYLRVRAVNDGGTGANSPTLTVSTAASATAPSISGITAGNGTLSVAFTAGESGGKTISNYQYSTDNGSTFTAVSPASTNSPILISGLTNGTSYTVQIRALNSDDTTGSASAGVSSTPRTTPGAPTGLIVTPGNTQLAASFTAPADNGGSAITNYEYSLNGGTSFTAVSPASTSTSITITGLTNGTAYNVQVRAVNDAGSGAATDSVSGTPRTTPSVTTGASSSIAAYSVTFAGNITNTGGNNPSMRGVEYSTNSGFTTGTGTQASSSGDFGTGVFTNSATNLASGSTYYYRAFASNSAGISYGTQSNFTTLTVPGGKDPDTANATTAFLGDTVSLSINSWKTFNSTARSFGAVFGRFGNANLTTGTSESNTNGVSPELDQFSVNTSRLTNTGTFYWTIRVSWGSGNDYWFDGPRAGWSDLGLTAPTNSPLSIEVSALNNPTSVTASNSGASTINLGWTRGVSGNDKDTLIVRSADTNFTAPTPGTAYSSGNSLGGDTVVYRGSETSYADTNLNASTTYYYRLYAENWSYYSSGADASATTAAPSPSVSVSGTPSAMSANYGVASTASQFTVSGANLSANMSVAAPAGFEVSTAIGSGYASSFTLTPSSGTVASTTIYVRLKSNATPGANSGNVTVSSTGASSQTVAVSGTITIPTMAMTVTSSAGALNGDYGATKLFADEVAGTSNSVTISFNPGVTADEVEVWTNLNNRDRADNDVNSDSIPDGIIPPDPPTDKPVGYVSGVYPSNGYFQAHPMSGSGGSTYTLTLNANKTGAYRLTARYRMNGGPWVWYNDAINGLGAKNRDHAITVTPVLARNMNVYEINTLNVNATGSRFDQRSTFESLTNSSNGRVNLDYLRNLGVNTLWFQPVHPNGVSGREPSGGWDSGTAAYDPGSPYAVKNFFEVMAEMSQGNTRSASMAAFTNFVAAADTKGVHVMLDAPFNHTAHDVEFGTKGLQVLAAAGLNTSGWSATDEIRTREARFFSRNDGTNAYSGPASSAANAAVAPDRDDFGKWRDVLDVFFGRYSSLITGYPGAQPSRDRAANTEDTINMADLRGTDGVTSDTAAVTRAVWQYFASYVPHWLEKTGLPANSSLADQATKGIDGLRADFGQGMPPQFWEYAINVAREHKWSFVFMTESLDGGLVTYRSNRHFDILNENIVFPWKNAANTTAHRTIFEDRRNSYGDGLVLLNNTSHDEAGYADPWEAFIRYAVGSTIDGAPMIMYGQEIGTGAGSGANTGSFDWFEFNFEKWIPHFKRYNSMEKQWTAWSANSLGVQNLMPNYSGVGKAREFSAALRSSSRWFLNPIGSGTADPNIFAVAKYETANASPATSDVVLAFVNLNRNSAEDNTFGIPSALGTLLGIEPNQFYNVKNIAAYLGPNNELPNRRSEFLWPTPRLGSDIISNGIYVGLNAVPTNNASWASAPYEAQYLKVYVAPGLTTGGSPSALTTIYGSASTNTSFTLSANNVHDGVTVTAPAGFQVSTNASSGFAGSFSFTNTGTIGATTVFARLAATNPVGTYSGNVTIASPGGTNKTVALAASTVTAKALTISGATATGRAFNGTNTVTVSGGELVGVVGADAVTLGGTPAGTTANANAGTNKAVTVTGYSISGASAGNYTITQPTGVTVTITPATPTIATAPTATAITEGQALSTSTLSGGSVTGVGGAAVGGNFTFSSPATVPAVGTANQSVTFTPSDSNYGTASGVASVTVNPAALPLPEGIKFNVSTNGVYTVVGSNNLPIEGATFTYLYTGRTNGFTGGSLNTNYGFMSFSNTNAPSLPGFYRVTATAGGGFTGTLSENYGIAGPLYRDINTTRSAGAVTNNLLRTTLLAAVQRVTTDSTLSTGTSGLTWTNPVAGFSTMANGASNANSVSMPSAAAVRLFVTNTNSISDTLTVVISDGFTPVTFPVTVTTTNGAATNLPTLTTTAAINSSTTFTNTNSAVVTNAPAGAVMSNVPTRTMSFMARPNRPITIQFRNPSDNQWYHVTAINLPFISAANQPRTNAEIRPAIFTPRTGVIRFLVDTNLSGWQARPVQ